MSLKPPNNNLDMVYTASKVILPNSKQIGVRTGRNVIQGATNPLLSGGHAPRNSQINRDLLASLKDQKYVTELVK